MSCEPTAVVRTGLGPLVCLALGISLLCCGGAKTGGRVERAAPAGPQITVKYDGREASWELRDAVFTSFRKSLILKDSDINDKAGRERGVVHRIYLANYELGMMPGRPYEYRRIDSAGRFRVEIELVAARDADESAPPRTGEYARRPGPYDCLSYVFVSHFEDGKDTSDPLGMSKLKGSVQVKSVSGDRVECEIDVTDDEEAVRGSFTARRLG